MKVIVHSRRPDRVVAYCLGLATSQTRGIRRGLLGKPQLASWIHVCGEGLDSRVRPQRGYQETKVRDFYVSN